MRTWANGISALLLICGAAGLFGQAGALDPTFDPGTGANGPIYKVVVQSDGRIIVIGGFTEFDSTPRNRIVRLNADGSVDGTLIRAREPTISFGMSPCGMKQSLLSAHLEWSMAKNA